MKKIDDRTAELAAVHEKYINIKKEAKNEQKPIKKVQNSPVLIGDDEIIRKALAATDGAKFQALFNGDASSYSGDESRADMGFCNMLAFWTGKDPEQMDRIFRSSGLYREKWDRKTGKSTYGEITINEAISGCSDTYRPGYHVGINWQASDSKDWTEEPEELACEVGSSEPSENILDKVIERPEDVFNPGYIGALALEKRNNPTNYALIKTRLKGIVNTQEVERLVKQAARPQLHIAAANESILIKDIFTDTPCTYLRIPAGWEMSDINGVSKTVASDFGVQKLVACVHPIYISKRIKNIETGIEKLEITFYRDFKWISVILDRTIVFSRQSIITLTDYGCQVSSETAKNLVSFFDDFEAENAYTIPLEKSINRFGWIDTESFFPYCDGLVPDTTGGVNELVKAFAPKGTIEKWMEEIEADRKRSPIFRFIIAASLASPLIYLLDQRVGIVHVWGGSQGGKTAAVKAGLSAWGNPDELMANFYTTSVGMERAAGTFHHMPLVIDEKQVINEKKIDPVELIYMLSLGKGKSRGNKHGGLQEYSTWQNIIMTTGEEPLTRENSQNGEITRVLELYAKPFNDTGRASEMHGIVAQNHGFAGKIFIESLTKALKNDSNHVRKAFDYIKNRLKSGDNLRSHMDLITTVCVADCLASMYVWNCPQDDAVKRATDMGSEIISKLETRTDTVSRAWDFVKAWIASNNSKFQTGLMETWGASDSEYLYIIPQYLNNALQDTGFAKEQCVREFGNRGYIVKSTNSDGVACTHSQKKINGKNIKVYRIDLKTLNEGDGEYEQTELP